MPGTFGAKGKLDYFAEGMAARQAGLSRATNPYRRKDTPAEVWWKGWDAEDVRLQKMGVA